jgi:hypothetical protein
MLRLTLGLLLSIAVAIPGDVRAQARRPSAPPQRRVTRPPAPPPPVITSPLEEFGHNIGDDYFLVNYARMIEYWQKLDSQSERLTIIAGWIPTRASPASWRSRRI